MQAQAAKLWGVKHLAGITLYSRLTNSGLGNHTIVALWLDKQQGTQTITCVCEQANERVQLQDGRAWVCFALAANTQRFVSDIRNTYLCISGDIQEQYRWYLIFWENDLETDLTTIVWNIQ